MANKTAVIISSNILFPKLFDAFLYQKIKGVKIIVCRSIEEIEDKILANSDNLILLDCVLNGFPCLEVIRYLRMEKNIVSTVFYFSDIQTDAYTYKAYELGASKVFHKPFDPDRVTDEIVQLIDCN